VSRRRDRGGRRAPRETGGPRRSERPDAQAPEAGRPARREQPSGAPFRRPPRIPFLAQVAILVAVFAIGTLVAELAGAANLGVALGVGQICFAIALVAVIVKT
jgi:hypothetical protein